MELITSSYLSPSGFVTVNYPRVLLSALHRTRRKQGQSMTLPKFTINANCNESQVNPRRSANYHPSIWDPKLIESLSTPFAYEFYDIRLEELKRDAKKLLKSAKAKDPCVQLKLIDSMQRLGVAYHFEEEIEEAITSLVYQDNTSDLYTTALQFRLLRGRGFFVSSDVFDKFRSRNGKFMDSLSGDVTGLLCLYEASHLGMHGEIVLDEAKEFSTKHLKALLGKLESDLAEQIQRSLEIPLYWRMPRTEARNFIDFYQKDVTKSSVLLELAKLDYNLVQSVYQRELGELAKWWSDMDFKHKLSFSRDRLMENYLWALGIVYEPQFSKCRTGLTKFVCILTAIDDIYDVYGSLDELECFTDAVYRWDTKAMENLPEYMKICYTAMFNFVNEMVNDVLNDHGFNIQPYIKKEWANLCTSYLVEARWFYSKYTPTLTEYLRHAWTSVGGPAAMVHAYFLQGLSLSDYSPDCIKSTCSELFYWSSIITRLSDDLGTSKAEMERGDVAKSIQCYMIKEGVSEEQARDHIKGLISYSWKKLNEEVAQKSLPKSIVNLSLNMARTAQCIFQDGDGIGTSNGVTKDRLISLIVNPVSTGCVPGSTHSDKNNDIIRGPKYI